VLQYNTIQYKTYNMPYVTKMLFLGAKCLYRQGQRMRMTDISKEVKE